MISARPKKGEKFFSPPFARGGPPKNKGFFFWPKTWVVKFCRDSKIARSLCGAVGMRSHAGVGEQECFEALSNDGINIQMIPPQKSRISV